MVWSDSEGSRKLGGSNDELHQTYQLCHELFEEVAGRNPLKCMFCGRGMELVWLSDPKHGLFFSIICFWLVVNWYVFVYISDWLLRWLSPSRVVARQDYLIELLIIYIDFPNASSPIKGTKSVTFLTFSISNLWDFDGNVPEPSL